MFGMIERSGKLDAKAFMLSPLMPLIDDVSKKTGCVELKSGDMLRVFNSITEGKEFLTVDIEYELDKYFIEYQKGIERALWIEMFRAQMPAKLTKPDGSVIDGQLHEFKEGGGWAIYDFDDKSYDSVHFLQDGDKLTVYSTITQGAAGWQGNLVIEDTPFPTGKTVTTYTPTADGKDYTTDTVPEIYARTHVTPPIETLDRWSLLRRPAMLVR